MMKRIGLITTVIIIVMLPTLLGTSATAAHMWVPVGENPKIVVVDSSGHRAYVANAGDKTISIVSTSEHRVINTISVHSVPQALALSPDQTELYIALASPQDPNSTSGSISVVSTATGTVSHDLPAGRIPSGIAVAPSGAALYVSNAGDNTVSVVNTKSRSIERTVPVGRSPRGIGFDILSKSVIVANSLDGSLSVISTKTDAVETIESGGVHPLDVVISASTKSMAASNFASKTVSLFAFSGGDWHLLRSVKLAAQPSAMASDLAGNYIYVSLPSHNSISIISVATEQIVSHIPVADSPFGLASSGQSNKLFIALKNKTLVAYSSSVVDIN